MAETLLVERTRLQGFPARPAPAEVAWGRVRVGDRVDDDVSGAGLFAWQACARRRVR